MLVNDNSRNNVCSRVECTKETGKFTGTRQIHYTINGTTSNYAITPIGLIECKCRYKHTYNLKFASLRE